jgi:hypothetical protein
MLSRGFIAQRSQRLANNTLISKFHNSPTQWFQNLFKSPIPKGFGKYYPPRTGKSNPGTDAKGTEMYHIPSLVPL